MADGMVQKFNPLGFVDGILEDWLALPAPRDIVPSPGDAVRAILGKDRTLAEIGRQASEKLKSAGPIRL